MSDEDRDFARVVDPSPLISEPLSVLCLKAEYAGNVNSELYMSGIDYLHRHYQSMRRVRRDGNCFFRALIFALFEQLLPSTTRRLLEEQHERDSTASLSDVNALSSRHDSVADCDPLDHASMSATAAAAASLLTSHIEKKIRVSKSNLISLGYSETAIIAFWETFMDYLATMDTRAHEELYPDNDFQTEGGESEYLVWYARLLTAGFLKQHADRFQPFIAGLHPGLSVEQFCGAEVEPMGKECDQPQIAALTEALDITVKIEYLDGRGTRGAALPHYTCSSAAEGHGCSQPTATTHSTDSEQDSASGSISIHLLYRPGHYDILYPRVADHDANGASI